MLERSVRLTLPRDEQNLLRTRSALRCSRLHSTLKGVDSQRPLLTVPDLDRRPCGFWQPAAPTIHAHEWVLGMPSASRVLWRRRVDVADQSVRGHRQQIPFATISQFQAKTSGTAHLVVARHPGMRQQLAVFIQHFQRQFMAGSELVLTGTPASSHRASSLVHSLGR